MKRKILCLLGVFLVAFTIVTGCAQQEDSQKKGNTEELTLEDFSHSIIGAQEGSLITTIIPNRFPDVDLRIYSSMADIVLSLFQGKIDVFAMDESYLVSMLWEDYDVTRVKEPLAKSDYAFAFSKTEKGVTLRTQVNEFIAKLKENGELDRLEKKWFSSSEPTEFDSYDDLTNINGTIKVGVSSASSRPFVYIKNNKLAGFDIEIIIRFCKEYGYKPEFDDVPFPSLLTGIKTKYDVIASGLTVTEERKEAMSFSDVYYVGDLIYIIPKDTIQKNTTFIENFEKTFIREDRWKLILNGILTTIIISIFSVVVGSLLGFGLYMLVHAKFKPVRDISKFITNIYTRIIAGTPIVVILMILFYIVFGKVTISGIIVSIIGFGLTFGAFVYDTLTNCVAGVDIGQTEAAMALGYNKNQTFFRIILPQAMVQFLPAYTGEIISLIKETAIVGYIAVQDLTKASDIIRSNTYEAFFPLISTAIIYFVLTWIISLILERIRKNFNPAKRKKENILKGV